MLDLETLGTKADTAVLSIGLVLFNREKILGEKYIVPSLSVQLKKAGRAVDASTLTWWMQQETAAKQVFKESNASILTISGAVSDMLTFINGVTRDPNLLVWSNGAGFDVPIIEHMIHSVNLEAPWKFWNIRCYRTLKCLYDIEKEALKGVKHNALDDARFQAECVMGFLQKNPELDR